MHSGTLVRIAIGGVLGAAGRWGLTEVLAAGSLPWPLLVANTIGCAVLGAASLGRTDEMRGVLGAGIAGGLTSMSALALWLALRLDSGAIGDAALTIAAMLVLGVTAHLAGEAVASKVLGRTVLPRGDTP
jgi:CrcB protein